MVYRSCMINFLQLYRKEDIWKMKKEIVEEKWREKGRGLKSAGGSNTVGSEMSQFFHASTFLATFVDDVAEILSEICHFCVYQTNRLAPVNAMS